MAEPTAEEKAAAEAAEKIKVAKANDAKITPEEWRKKLDAANAKVASVTEETIERRQRIRTLEQEQDKKSEAALKEQNKYKELYEAAQPKVKRLEELETVVNQILETKKEVVPEDKRHLIPGGTPETQLKWIEDAVASGLFYPKGGEPPKSDPPKVSKQNQPKDDNKNMTDYLTWASDDARLTSLSLPQYAEWQKHNGKIVTGDPKSKTQAALGVLPAR